MSEAPPSTALQMLYGSARTLLDVAAVAAAEGRESAGQTSDAKSADRVAYALQAVLRQAHAEAIPDQHLMTGLVASVGMFMTHQQLTRDVDDFLSAFGLGVRASVAALSTPPRLHS